VGNGQSDMQHPPQHFLSGLVFIGTLPFLLLGGGAWSMAFGVAVLVLDLALIAWACWRSMRFLRTRTRWPEVLHGLPILVVAPVTYLAANCLVVLVFWNWPGLPH
jgi:hypothetical protein